MKNLVLKIIRYEIVKFHYPLNWFMHNTEDYLTKIFVQIYASA